MRTPLALVLVSCMSVAALAQKAAYEDDIRALTGAGKIENKTY
jgi:hypothetical protein